MFKLQVGSVCKLSKVITSGFDKKNDWRTGLYRVVAIYPAFGSSPSDRSNPKCQSYQFEKIRKDGTAYKSFCNGYNCLAWDKMIDTGIVGLK